jgi:hypothetical protein
VTIPKVCALDFSLIGRMRTILCLAKRSATPVGNKQTRSGLRCRIAIVAESHLVFCGRMRGQPGHYAFPATGQLPGHA